MGSLSESIVLDFLYRYGEKAFIVLKAAYEIYQSNLVSGKKLLGDFDFKALVGKLRERGFNYNPNQLLRILERDFGIIETTYRSSNQRWWKFTDAGAVSRALNIYEGKGDDLIEDEPELTLLKLQVDLIDVDKMLGLISELISKEYISSAEKERIKKVLFNEIPLIVKLFKETQAFEDEFRDFNSKVRLMFKYLSILVKKFKGVNISVSDLEGGGLEAINRTSVKLDETN